MKKALLISCFGWYEKRLKPIKNLIQTEYDCEILAGDFLHAFKTPVIDRNEDCTYIHVLPYKKNLSFSRLYSHYDFSRKIFRLLQSEKPDLIYVLLPPNSLGKYCGKYRNQHSNCRLIFDVIDMWPESMPLDKVKNTFPCRIWRNMRNKALFKADYVFTECELYQYELKEYLPSNFATLHLMKKQTSEETELVREKISCIQPLQSKNEITIGYVGSINNIIDINLIKSIIETLLSEFNVTVRIIGDGENRKELIRRIEEVGASVEFFGKIFDEKRKIEILSDCDVALNIMKENLKVGLTIKSIDYFAYGLPIINNIKGDTWNLVATEIPGINYSGDAQDVLDFVKQLRREDHLKVLELYGKYFSENAFNATIKNAFSQIIKE